MQPVAQPFAYGIPTTTNPRDVIGYLASDALAGRLPGSPGITQAGDFLAAECLHIGLKPVGDSYFQSFEMAQASTLNSSTQLTVNGQGELPTKDFAPMGLTAEGNFRGPVIFAGFGITTDASEKVQYDDYTRLDAHRKVVLALMKEPLDAKGASKLATVPAHWSDHALFVKKAKNAADHGAVALLLVAPPASGGPDLISPYDGNGHRSTSIPVIQISRRLANVILSLGGSTNLQALQDGIASEFKPSSVDLKDLEIAGSVVVEHKSVPMRNVLATLPGSGPHADEWMVIGAHYDHLGLGQLGHMAGGAAGSIWHGADDNASGTAAVLALADRLKHSPPLPRSILFLFFSGEEEGLIGSDYYVKHPLIPLEKVVAMLNLDMVGRLHNNVLEIGGAGTAPILDSVVRNAIRGTKLTTTIALPDEGGRGGIGPSDHMSFARHHIPVLFLFTGLHADYHRPTDTADKINYAGVDQVIGVSRHIAEQFARMPRQLYDSSSDQNSMSRLMAGGGGHRAVLGVVPDESAAEVTNGVPISGVVTGGPAEKAGLKANDLLVAFNGKPLKTLGDLSQALTDAHGGDNVTVKVIRDSKPIELHAVLDEPK